MLLSSIESFQLVGSNLFYLPITAFTTAKYLSISTLTCSCTGRKYFS